MKPAGTGTRATPRDRRGGRDGFVVVAALAVLALLTALVGGLALVARGGIDAARTADERLRLDALARAGTELVAYELYGLRRPARAVTGREIRLDDGAIAVRVEDEAGKVDLNGSDPALVAGIYREAGLGALEPAAFAARVAAWRARFRTPAGGQGARDGGARDSGARDGGPKDGGTPDGGAREDAFRSVADIAWLPGVTQADARALAALVTVHNPGGRIEPLAAPEAVLRALPGVGPPLVERVLAARLEAPQRAAATVAALLRGQQALLGARAGRAFRLVLDVRTRANARARLRLTLVRAPAAQGLYYTTDHETLY